MLKVMAALSSEPEMIESRSQPDQVNGDSLLAYGVSLPPGEGPEQHPDADDQFRFVLKGKRQITARGCIFIVEEGEAGYFQRDQPHESVALETMDAIIFKVTSQPRSELAGSH